MAFRAPQRASLPAEPFTLAQAYGAGYTAQAVRHAVASGRWGRLRLGVYHVVSAEPVPPNRDGRQLDLIRAAQAAQLSHPDAVISHSAAAAIHGLPTYRATPLACLTLDSGAPRRSVVQAHLHRATTTEPDVGLVDELAVTSIARSVADIARERGIDAAVVTADAALHDHRVTHEELQDVLDRQRRWPGHAAAKHTIEHCRSLAESPLESLSRLRIATCGIPEPTLQQEIGDEDGQFLARVDFYWDEFGVVGEADGALKYDNLAAVTAEKRRQSRLLETGLIVVRWEWSDLRTFELVARRLESAFARGRRRGSGRAWSLR